VVDDRKDVETKADDKKIIRLDSGKLKKQNSLNYGNNFEYDQDKDGKKILRLHSRKINYMEVEKRFGADDSNRI